MALRAKKPILQEPRLKALIYADKGAGKTHFCCTFPDTYYIDTEGVEDYPQFVKMIRDNNGDLIYLTELSEIIKEVKDLINTKHNYKTLVIDSISFPYAWIAQMEAERLAIKSPHTEGTEFGANLAKAKRLIFQLGILLSRLDMNVLCISHERVKYSDGKEVGKTFDISDKMAYSLGAVWNLRLQGKQHKLFVEKSRYTEMTTNESIDFDNGYEVIKTLFGEDIFKRESKSEELALPEQIKQYKHLVQLLNVSDETQQKWLRNAKAQEVEEMTKAYIQKAIDYLQSQIEGEAA
jgi:hypothetical protein